MPLLYDDVGGSWGPQSDGWPEIVFSSEDEARRAYIACTKAKIVPYGSYVLMTAKGPLRVETESLKDKLVEYLAASPHKTFADLRQHFINEGLWL